MNSVLGFVVENWLTISAIVVAVFALLWIFVRKTTTEKDDAVLKVLEENFKKLDEYIKTKKEKQDEEANKK